MRCIIWIIWSIIWFVGNQKLAAAGMIPPPSTFWLLFDCAFSCFAATIFARNKVLCTIGIIYLVLVVIYHRDIPALFSLVLNLLLIGAMIATKKPERA